MHGSSCFRVGGLKIFFEPITGVETSAEAGRIPWNNAIHPAFGLDSLDFNTCCRENLLFVDMRQARIVHEALVGLRLMRVFKPSEAEPEIHPSSALIIVVSYHPCWRRHLSSDH